MGLRFKNSLMVRCKEAAFMFVSIRLVLILHQSHSHSHGLTEEHRNTSVRAAFIHTLGDLLQSFGVLMAATIIYFQVSNIISENFSF